MPASTSTDLSARPKRFSPQWWVRDSDGRVVLAQAPNPAIGIWLVTVVVGWTGVLDGSRAATVTAVGRGALLAWAADEVLRGASPVRRLIGAVVAVVLVVRVLG